MKMVIECGSNFTQGPMRGAIFCLFTFLGEGGGGGGPGKGGKMRTRGGRGWLVNFTVPEERKVDFGRKICLGDIPFKGFKAIIKS